MQNIQILLDSARGVYIPQNFAEQCGGLWSGFDAEDLDVLHAGPGHCFYWDTWNRVLDSAYIISGEKTYTLFQGPDGDLFAIAYDHLSTEEKSNFGFDDCY